MSCSHPGLPYKASWFLAAHETDRQRQPEGEKARVEELTELIQKWMGDVVLWFGCQPWEWSPSRENSHSSRLQGPHCFPCLISDFHF